MKHILIITDSKPTNRLGGPGRFAPHLFSELKKKSWDQYGVTGIFSGKFIKKSEEIEFEENSTKDVTTKSSASLWLNNFPLLSALTRVVYHHIKATSLIRNLFGADPLVKVIHAHDFNSVYRYKGFPGKIVMTNHFKGSLYGESVKYRPGMDNLAWTKYYQHIEKSAIHRADKITFPSLSAMNLLIDDYPDLREIIKAKSLVLYTGIKPVNTNRPSDFYPYNDRYIINIGNHIPDKGVDIALDAFLRLEKNIPGLKFINVGKFDIGTEKLQQKISNLGLSDKVKLMGVVEFETVKKLLADAFLVIHTPRRVVFDLSLLEAMSVGVPILASTAQGNVEALGEDYPLLVEQSAPLEKISSLASTLLTPEEYRNISINQKIRFSEKFSFDTMLTSYQKLYEDILK